MSAPGVSVLVPMRDAEPYIAEALDSVFAQTLPPAEVIVVDDGSEDGSAEIVAGYDEPVRLLRQDPGGIGVAVNRARSAAGGELLAFIDADDLWTPNKLELQCAALAADPGLDLVFGEAEPFISPDLPADERGRLKAPPPAGPAKLKGTMLIRREAYDRVGPFSTDIRLADFVDWYLRASEAGLREEMLASVVLRRRLHGANTGRGLPGARGDYALALGRALRRRRLAQRSSG